MRVALALSGLALLAVLPAAQGHGLVNAGELEVLMVQDEASDLVTGTDYGYDLVQIYVGEAYVPGLGDGFYVHTILYGGAGDRPMVDGPQTVAFEFEIDGKPIERSFSTADGQTFEGDFDQLTVVPGDGEVEVQRAFVLYPDGVGPGSVMTSVVAVSFVNDQPRDVAPGGVYIGGVETDQGDSEQVVDSYMLKGPTGHFSQVEVITMTDGDFLVTAWSGLKLGSQHILLSAEPRDGWSATFEGQGGETPPGGTQIFQVRLVPGNGSYTFDLHSDIGGHVPLVATNTPDGLRLSGPGTSALQAAPQEKDAALPPLLLPFGLAVALLARRVKG